MTNFFCAEESRHAGEDPIGTAATHPTYVLVECPPLWGEDEFAASISEQLRAFINQVYTTKQLPFQKVGIMDDW